MTPPLFHNAPVGSPADDVGRLEKTAEWFEIYSSFDNLDNAANLQWSLRENAQDSEGNDYAGNVIQSGALACEGQDYADWSSEPDANAWVIDWAATELNIVLIPA